MCSAYLVSERVDSPKILTPFVGVSGAMSRAKTVVFGRDLSIVHERRRRRNVAPHVCGFAGGHTVITGRVVVLVSGDDHGCEPTLNSLISLLARKARLDTLPLRCRRLITLTGYAQKH